MAVLQMKKKKTNPPSGGARTRVLVTGAAGRMGAYFSRNCKKYALRLQVHHLDDKARKLAAFGEVIEGDLSDLKFLKKICTGIDVVLHLAGDPNPSATWDSLLENNIIGTYHLFAAAKAARCRRVIYASSIHAVSGYPADVQVKPDDPVNPGDLYGVSKCFGEALARYMAGQEGLSVIALRIGACQPLENAQKAGCLHNMDAFLSFADFQQLAERCIDDESVHFAIFHALSHNKFKRLDISSARECLGYAPQDDFFAENPDLSASSKPELRRHSLRDQAQKSGLRKNLH